MTFDPGKTLSRKEEYESTRHAEFWFSEIVRTIEAPDTEHAPQIGKQGPPRSGKTRPKTLLPINHHRPPASIAPVC